MMAWYAGQPLQKPLEKLLEGNPKLSAILDDGDFMQELKAFNPKLLEYITTTPDLIREAIEYLVVVPQQTDSVQRKYKYPLMAVEMVETETISVLNSFLKPLPSGNGIYLDLLFESLDQEVVLPLLAGYFLRVCSTLLNSKYRELTQYFYCRPGLFKKLLKHCHIASLMQVVSLMLNVQATKADKPYQQRRPRKMECILQCLNCIEQHRKDADGLVVQNISNVFIELIDKYYLIADGKEMLDIILTEKPIEMLLGMSSDMNTLISQPAINTLVSLVNYYSFSALNSEDKNNVEFSRKNRQRLEAQPLIIQLTQRFEQSAERLRSMPSFSLQAFKKLELLCHCISLNSQSIFTAVRKVNFFGLLLDLMYKFPDANIMHNLIEKTFLHIFGNQKPLFEGYRQHLFCDIDIIGRTANVVIKKEMRSQGFYGHLMRIIKIYSSIQTINQNIIQTIKAYTDLWTKVAISVLKPYDDCCSKDLGSYQIDLPQSTVEYKIRQMSFIAPQPKNIISEVIDEEAKFMKTSGTSQVHADSLEVSAQPNIIESDNFFKLPIQEVMSQSKNLVEPNPPLNSTVESHTSEEQPPTLKKKMDSFEEFLQKKKAQAGQTLKTQRTASQQRRFTPNKGPKMASPSPRKKNSWADTNSEDDAKTKEKEQPKFFKKEQKIIPPPIPLAKKNPQPNAAPLIDQQSSLTQSSPDMFPSKQNIRNPDEDPLAMSMGNLNDLRNIKIKMSNTKSSEVKKCRKFEEKDLMLLNFLGIKINK